MKGVLIKNTLMIGILVIFYYLSLMVVQYIYSLFDVAFAGITDWRASFDPNAQIFLGFIFYIIIPLAIMIAFIIHTKPQQEQISLRRF